MPRTVSVERMASDSGATKSMLTRNSLSAYCCMMEN